MYDYKEIRPRLFTEDNQKLFIAIRDKVHGFLKMAGAVRMEEVVHLPRGISCAHSWDMMACVDRLVELDEIVEVPTKGVAQHRVFVKKND